MPGFFLSSQKEDTELNFNKGDESALQQCDIAEIKTGVNVINAFKRYKFFIVICAILGLVFTYIKFSGLPKKYEAKTIVMCKVEDIKDKQGEAVITTIKSNPKMLKKIVVDSIISKDELINEVKQKGFLTEQNEKVLQKMSLESMIDINIPKKLPKKASSIIIIKSYFFDDKKLTAFLADYFAKILIMNVIKRLNKANSEGFPLSNSFHKMTYKS